MKDVNKQQQNSYFCVSIPYRFNESALSIFYLVNFFKFQFLIGSMKVSVSAVKDALASAFQFLIGSMKAKWASQRKLLC